MEPSLTMPDASIPQTKVLKKEKEKVDKIYGPFMMKFFSSTGSFTLALKTLHNQLMVQLTNMLDAMDVVATNTGDAQKFNEKEKTPDKEKKKQSWISEKWQKVIKSNFFQKTLGFLKGLASVNFITQLLTFLILLRMGIIQKFLPWFLGIIGGAITTLIKFLPTLLKFFWNLLWNVIPGILKQIFRSVIDMFGLTNPIWKKISDVIAQFLPLLLAIIWAVGFLAPIVSFIVSAVSVIGTVISVIGTVLSVIGSIIAFIFSPIGLIIAAVVGLVALVWIFRKEIWNFLVWIGTAFYKYVISPIVAILTIIAMLYYEYIIKPLISFFTWLGGLFYNYVIAPIWKGVKWVFTKYIDMGKWVFKMMKKGFSTLVSFFTSTFVDPIKRLFSAIASIASPVIEALAPILSAIGSVFSTIKDKIKNVLGSISDIIQDIFKWFGGAAAFGGYDWATVGAEKRSQFMENKSKFETNKYVQMAQSGLTETAARAEVEKSGGKFDTWQYQNLQAVKAKNKDAELADILAAQASGILKFLDGVKEDDSSKTIGAALQFVTNNTSTQKNTVK